MSNQNRISITIITNVLKVIPILTNRLILCLYVTIIDGIRTTMVNNPNIKEG